jgi:hypothetical protein
VRRVQEVILGFQVWLPSESPSCDRTVVDDERRAGALGSLAPAGGVHRWRAGAEAQVGRLGPSRALVRGAQAPNALASRRYPPPVANGFPNLNNPTLEHGSCLSLSDLSACLLVCSSPAT